MWSQNVAFNPKLRWEGEEDFACGWVSLTPFHFRGPVPDSFPDIHISCCPLGLYVDDGLGGFWYKLSSKFRVSLPHILQIAIWSINQLKQLHCWEVLPGLLVSLGLFTMASHESLCRLPLYTSLLPFLASHLLAHDFPATLASFLPFEHFRPQDLCTGCSFFWNTILRPSHILLLLFVALVSSQMSLPI